MLRSIGDKLAALAFLIFSALVNVILISILLRNCKFGCSICGTCYHYFAKDCHGLCFNISVRVFQNYSQLKHFKWTRLSGGISWSKVCHGWMSSIVSIGVIYSLLSILLEPGLLVLKQQLDALWLFALPPMTAISSAMTTLPLKKSRGQATRPHSSRPWCWECLSMFLRFCLYFLPCLGS